MRAVFDILAVVGIGCAVICVALGAEPDPGGVYVSELMAASTGRLADRDGDFSDWIEIHNPTDAAIDLTGWYLTDDPDDLTKFKLPGLVLAPDGYRVIFASGKEGNSLFQAEIHTNFTLQIEGEYLALVASDGSTLVHAYDDYPGQRPGVSYGYAGGPDDGLRAGYFVGISPSAPNGRQWPGEVGDTRFSIDRGLYSEPLTVEITTETPEAVIVYTTDGREPGLGNPFTGIIGEIYDAEKGIALATTTTLRAVATKTGHLPSNIDTQTYLFPDHVPDQPDEPEGFPTTWQGADYGMDQDPDHLPRIAGDPALTVPEAKQVIAASLRSLSTLSLVLDVDGMFGRADGIYDNSEGRGQEWERPVSVELIHPDGRAGFQVDAGIRMQGFTSRNAARNPKHSLRLLFKERYGAGKLRYPVFGSGAAAAFDTLVLRSNAQDAWVYDSTGNRAGQFVRDEWNRRMQAAMGWPACHGTWVHLYINGIYWGVYNPTERPDASFLAAYLGGDESEFDVVKNHEEIIEGERGAFDALLGLIQNNAGNFASGYRDFSGNAAYFAVQGRNPDGSVNSQIPELLDVPNLIDYMIHNMYSAAQDWPGNFYMGRDRSGMSGGFKFFSWDNEHGMKSSVNENRTLPHSRDADSPTKFHHPLRDNAEYRLLFGDHLHRAFFNQGCLATDPTNPAWDPEHPERNRPAALWMAITGEIEQALIAESARWGDYRRGTPYTVRDDFETLRQGLLENWFPQRSALVLDQFRQQGLYPEVEAPIFNQHGGFVASGFQLSMRSRDLAGIFDPNGGKIFYTIDGSDPRLLGGALNEASALAYGGPVALDRSVTIRARLIDGEIWSALNEATFQVDSEPATKANLVISEIHYRPSEPDEEARAAGFDAASSFEFLELMNVGSMTVSLAGVRFTDGIRFVFDEGSRVRELKAGERLLVVNDVGAFSQRYGSLPRIAGEYTDSRLNNAGETLRLEDANGEVIVLLTYADRAPWPDTADGAYSLVLKNPQAKERLDDPTSWKLSAFLDGSPGRGEDEPAEKFNEWMRQLGLTDPAGDPDGNGLSHFAEYALGRDLSAGTALVVILDSGPGVILRHPVRLDADDVSFTVQGSLDLQTWTPLEIESEETEVLTNGVGLRSLRSGQGTEAAGRFFRLSMTASP